MNRTRMLLPALLAVVLAALAVACGTATPPANTGSGATVSSQPIKLGYSAWPGWFPWRVAEEAGIFKEAGVDVELVWFEGYLDSINALTAGQLDANSQTLNDTLTAVAAGADQRIVLVNDNSTGNDQIIVDKSISSVSMLKGRKIGVEAGVVDHFLLALGLKAAGLSLNDVEIVNMETGAAAAAFAAGQMDGVGAFAPFTTQALKRPGATTLISSKDFPGAIPDHLVVRGDLLKERPDDVQKLVNAWFMTLDYMKANPQRALTIMSKQAGVSESEYKAYDAGTTIFTLDQNLSAFTPGNDMTRLNYAAQEIGKFLLENKFIEKKVDVSKVLDDSFVRSYAASKR